MKTRFSTLLLAACAGLLAAQALPARGADAEASQGSASPRAAVQRFVDLCRAGQYGAASAYLEGDPGPREARRFKAVLDRRLWLDMDRISDRPGGDPADQLPDGVDQIGTIAGIAGPEPVRVTRVGASGEEHWVFTRVTVGRIDGWFGLLGNGWLLDLLPDALLRPGPRELALWQWLALPLAALLSILVGRLGGAGVRRALETLARRTRTTWDDAIIGRLHGPLYACCGLLSAEYVFVPLLGLYPPAVAYLGRLLHAGLFLTAFWASFRVADLLGELTLKLPWASDGARALVPLSVRAGKVGVVALGLVAVLSDFGYPVASLLAGLGIGGLALALAAQKTGENLFGSISIAVDRPFEAGDFVRIEDFVGTVETVGLRSTRVRTLDRTLITIPNGKLADMRVECYSVRDRIRLACTVGLVYETRAEQMRTVLAGFESVLRAHPKIWPDAVIVRFVNLGASSLDVDVMAWFQTSDWNEFQTIRQDVLLSFMDVVEKAGTSMAFPTQTLHVVADPPAPN